MGGCGFCFCGGGGWVGVGMCVGSKLGVEVGGAGMG